MVKVTLDEQEQSEFSTLIGDILQETDKPGIFEIDQKYLDWVEKWKNYEEKRSNK